MTALDKHSMLYGRKSIDFRLVYCDRKTLEIAVHPDSTVIVKAPVQSDIGLIEKKILKRARWILKQLNDFKQFNPRTPPRCYVNGETHLYLGKQYRLKVTKGKENSVKLFRGYFHVTCYNQASPQLAERLLHEWYLEKATSLFEERVEHCWSKLKKYSFQKPTVSLRRMQKRWGSLSERGKLTLNTDLIRAPKECIDYVITHELCHLKYRNHDNKFRKLLCSLMPEWERRKNKLEMCLC